MASAVGAGQSQGKTSSGYVYIGSRSRVPPGTTRQIPQGTVVSTVDGKYVYQTTETTEINGDYPGLYFNPDPTLRTYEVRVPIAAVAVGSDYNIPARRIRRLVSTLTGIDFVQNREATTGGIDVGGSDELVARAQTKFKGISNGNPAGLAALIVEGFSDAGRITVVTSADYELFKRALDGPGLDYYYTGQILQKSTLTYTAIGGEISATIPNQPVQSISAVRVNGASVSYSFVQDTNRATKGSTTDTSYISLSAPLAASDRLDVDYEYDSLAASIEEDYGGNQGFFGTSIVIRRAIRVAVRIELTAQVLTNFNPITLKSTIMTEITDFFASGENNEGPLFLPSDFNDHLRKKVVGIRGNIDLTTFQLVDRGLLSVEPIEPRLNELVEIDTDYITVTVQ